MSEIYPIYINTSIDMDDPYIYYLGYTTLFIDASANDITIQLTGYPYDGLVYDLLRVDNSSNSVTIVSTNGYTINNKENITLEPFQETYTMCFGLNWYAPIYSFST